jgi:hypothetical protein
VSSLKPQVQKGVCHTVALPFALKKKSILRQKKNYENSNISPCKKYNLQKINQNTSRYYNSKLISIFNTSQNIIFQKSSYKNRPIT